MPRGTRRIGSTWRRGTTQRRCGRTTADLATVGDCRPQKKRGGAPSEGRQPQPRHARAFIAPAMATTTRSPRRPSVEKQDDHGGQPQDSRQVEHGWSEGRGVAVESDEEDAAASKEGRGHRNEDWGAQRQWRTPGTRPARRG